MVILHKNQALVFVCVSEFIQSSELCADCKERGKGEGKEGEE